MNRQTQSLCVLAILLFASTATAQTSTPAEFTELGELLVGRWVSDITLIADWPEFSKKQGEKVNGYLTVKWVADRNGVEEEELIAEGGGTGLYFWEAASKSIKCVRVTTAGTTSTTTYWKKDGVWQWCHAAAQRDGKKVEGAGQLLFEDNGKTMIGDGDLTLDGKPLLHYRDVYRRVGK